MSSHSDKAKSGGRAASHAPETFLEHVRRAMPVILVTSLVTFLLEYFGLLAAFETKALDFWLHLPGGKPLQPQYVWIVSVTDEDYKNLFEGHSPLNPEKLWEIIQAVRRGSPRVIGVDIDTEDSKGMPPDHGIEKEGGAGRVVWGQAFGQDGKFLVPHPVLGGETPQPPLEERGLVTFPPPDRDHVFRRYARKLPTVEGEMGSLAWAVVKMFCLNTIRDTGNPVPNEERAQCEELLQSESEERYRESCVISFCEPRHAEVHFLSASDVLKMYDPKAAANSLLKGKIVLLGGTFGKSGDFHETPVGRMSGLEFTAAAVESEMQSRLVTKVNEVLMVAFEIMGGCLLASWQFFCHRRKWGRVWGWVPVPLLALASSLAAFKSFAYWGNFVPVLVGVLLHKSHEHIEEHRRLRALAGEVE